MPTARIKSVSLPKWMAVSKIFHVYCQPWIWSMTLSLLDMNCTQKCSRSKQKDMEAPDPSLPIPELCHTQPCFSLLSSGTIYYWDVHQKGDKKQGETLRGFPMLMGSCSSILFLLFLRIKYSSCCLIILTLLSPTWHGLQPIPISLENTSNSKEPFHTNKGIQIGILFIPHKQDVRASLTTPWGIQMALMEPCG